MVYELLSLSLQQESYSNNHLQLYLGCSEPCQVGKESYPKPSTLKILGGVLLPKCHVWGPKGLGSRVQGLQGFSN